jgi:hypothetical protein
MPCQGAMRHALSALGQAALPTVACARCWRRTHPWLYPPACAGGAARMDYFKKGVAAPDASASAVKWDFSGLSRADVWVGGGSAAGHGACR